MSELNTGTTAFATPPQAPPGRPRPFNAARAQALISGLLLLIIGGTCLGVDYLSRSSRVASWLMRSELRKWKQENLQYQHRIYFADFEDRLLLEELPQADYSTGGVYFLGASNIKVSIMPWLLDDELRRRTGNYGLSAARHSQQFQFLRLLVEHRGLAAAGDKTLIVLGLYHTTAVAVGDGDNAEYFASLFRRHGLYTYDPAGGMAPVALSDLERTIRIRKARCAGFLKALRTGGTRNSFKPARHNPEAYRQDRIKYMGPRWKEEMADQVAELDRMIAYIQAHNLRVMAVYLPLASWDNSLPYAAEYKRLTQAICQGRNVPVTDFSDLLADDKFHDSTHANYVGQQKLHQALLEIVKAHLHAVDGN